MTVYLVGAGPGDPGLITVRGAQVLAEAEVVVHDRLASPELVDLAPATARRIDVGKSPGSPIDQEEICAVLVALAGEGLRVVRLKGGDPFIFGRGGEEAAALAAAGVDFEVVPGISSAVAVPAYAGIPVTHRGLATSYTVVTGHSRHHVDTDTNWDALAKAGGTIVVLMGVAHRGQIAERLMAGGLSPSTPVAATRWGTRPDQTTIRTTLADLASVALEPPVTLVVGAVAALDLSWFDRRPLFGRRIVVTRSRSQSSTLVRRLAELGAQVVEMPTIEVEAAADAGQALAAAASDTRAGAYDWVAFTSANAVERFFACLRDSRDLGGVGVAAVGCATEAALARRGVVADLVPETALADALAEALVARGAAGPRRVLLPQAAGARPTLAEALSNAGWDVTAVEAYRTVAAPVDEAVQRAAAAADAVAFTSSSTVTNYVAAFGGPTYTPPSGPARPVVACIGPVTAATAEAAGFVVDVVATQASVEGLAGALVKTFAGRPLPSPE